MTKRQHVGSSWVEKIRRGGTALAAIGMMGSLAVTASGCDTVALISFSERSFQSIESAGFSPPQGSATCEGVSAEDGDMNLRFVLVDNEGMPIRLGEAVDGRAVELGPDSLELSNSAFMEVIDSGSCTSNDQCSSGFSCAVASGLQEDTSLQACLRPDTGFSVGSGSSAVRFVSDTDAHQVFGFLMENSGSLTGWNPKYSEGAWDLNGNGVTGDMEDAPARSAIQVGRDIATDYRGGRRGAVLQAKTSWENAHALAQSEDRQTYFGLWNFNEVDDEANSFVEKFSASDSHWTRDLGVVDEAIDDYFTGNEQNPYDARANVYESIQKVIEDHYSVSAMESLDLTRATEVDKQLVVFVDGYDDMRENDNATIDSVIEAAEDHNVRVFIVHLDPKLTEPGTLRDDPRYPNKQEACGSDADCKNFESCMKPRGYSATAGNSTSVPSGSGADYDLDQTFCIPKRDDFGRTGPIDDYARMACATGGGYIYVPSPNALDRHLGWTPLALDGLWEAQVSSVDIARGNAPAGEALRVHTEMSVTVAGQQRTYDYSQLGGVGGADANADEFDTRGVIFTRDEE